MRLGVVLVALAAIVPLASAFQLGPHVARHSPLSLQHGKSAFADTQKRIPAYSRVEPAGSLAQVAAFGTVTLSSLIAMFVALSAFGNSVQEHPAAAVLKGAGATALEMVKPASLAGFVYRIFTVFLVGEAVVALANPALITEAGVAFVDPALISEFLFPHSGLRREFTEVRNTRNPKPETVAARSWGEG
ncbi:hypothetical protein T484DRAFT_1745255 [Baffinella frigidus]|nr:hypothetical protein T484DRAFT_1745255 [Cryptophyta sp. CCMP2293]